VTATQEAAQGSHYGYGVLAFGAAAATAAYLYKQRQQKVADNTNNSTTEFLIETDEEFVQV